MTSNERLEGDNEAILIIASSEIDSNLYFATGFLAPDPFIYLEVEGEKILLMSDLEIDRARKEARVDTTLSYATYEDRARQEGTEKPRSIDVVNALLRERGVTALLVPESFGIGLADPLREKGYFIRSKREPFFEARTVKTEEEIGLITETLRHTEAVMERAIAILREADVRGGALHWQGEVLTSERLKQVINVALMERECVAQHTIVACGVDACDPHNEGSGTLRAGEAIILDVFPRSSRSRYFADITRTVVKGRAKDSLKRLYETVLEGQEIAFSRIRHGASGQAIHQAILDHFRSKGYETGLQNGRMQGYFHGTGHGLGLDVHEPPRISKMDDTLHSGHAVTVEPGLYYPDLGAVRIEDLVVVTETGCRNLTQFPKELEIP
ncbi:MAG: aminopeptidase P family protein [Nitrospirae bacterium]|nr:aminopeptidase P family protein [Nitrospirota bacterium]